MGSVKCLDVRHDAKEGPYQGEAPASIEYRENPAKPKPKR